MKCLTNNSYLKMIYSKGYEDKEDICHLSLNCGYPGVMCIDCILTTERSKEEFNRITENKTKLVTVEEVQEAMTILVILG